MLGGAALLFRWNDVHELDVGEYMDAVRRIASRCEQNRSRAVVIDTRRLHVDVRFDDGWWRREILPAYQRTGVERFAHVIAGPDAPGEWDEVPEGVTFAMGRLSDLGEAFRWANDKENKMADQTILDETDQYRIVSDGDGNTLLLNWKQIDGQLSVEDDRGAVRRFAEQCRTRKPQRAVIDVHRLADQEEASEHGHEEFGTWWLREIAPSFHEAGIAGLAIVIGAPNAPGETDDLPPCVRFKRGYFSDLQAAISWPLG